jgi:UDP-N-acetylmuramoyl-tripeptide--D-alanyl-D-alanine ligase
VNIVIQSMTLTNINSILNGRQLGSDVSFSHISTDTRTLQPGDLYVALLGKNFDGNDYVDQAFEKGACAAIANRVFDNVFPHIVVEDTTIALGELARMNRLASTAKVVAITGSQGKTTVKEMIGKILSQSGEVLLTHANLNNQIGVPLTLLELEARHDFAVIELGASRSGDIAYTVRLVCPHVSVLTNATATHLEGLKDLQGVVRTKGEILEGLDSNGIAVLNADSAFFSQWSDRAKGRALLSFGIIDSADFRARDISIDHGVGSHFILHTPMGEISINLKLQGLHNVSNALASAAASIAAGANLQQVKSGLEKMSPVVGRLHQMEGPRKSVLIDDSYNASPASTRAAIDVLAKFPGTRVLIMGDMAELGDIAENAHKDVGSYAKEKGIDVVWTIGNLSSLIANEFSGNSTHFKSKEELVKHASVTLKSDFTVLVKGSRSARMNEVVKKLKTEGVS